ncbi:MAG TPA: cytochrome c [Dongiaceae bacterium]|nr:cytochrome c [Dongiaceae bacterium]
MTSERSSRFKRIAGWSFTALITALAVLITVTVGWRPVLGAKSRELTDRRFERTPERLAHGKYLVEGVLACLDCHSQVNEEPKAGEAPVLTARGGGRVMVNEKGLVVAAPNITPDTETGAGTWTDDQLARAIREGIGHDGRTLFPIMPYPYYRSLSDEDLASVIVYIRSLDPVHNALPKAQIPFPLSRLINSAPEPVLTAVVYTENDAISRGKYLALVGGCVDCHTPEDKMHRPIEGMEFAGGKQIEGFPARSANITPDASGISYYNEDLFLKVMRTGHVGARPLNPPMPWWVYRNMNDEDLKAIFAYLRTVKPIHNRVGNSEVASR